MYINPILHTYNCTRNESTGILEYFFMFGRNLRLSIADEFGIKNKSNENQPKKCINELMENTKAAYDLVNMNTTKAQGKQIEGYDQRMRGAEI